MPPGEERPPLVILLGPTASGKTTLAAGWAEAAAGEIVSADSVQVYRYMDIGTAKPSAELRQRIPHHLIDVADPDETFSAARYRAEAEAAIRETRARGRIPLVVGGTGLYLKVLTEGLFEGPGGDHGLRRRFYREADTQGRESLHRRLERVDPRAAGRIHPHDLFRVIRALEVYYLTGTPISEHQSSHRFRGKRYRSVYLGLTVDRAALYRRIDSRVEEMVDGGLVREVENLVSRGYGPELPSMQAIGYRHIGQYLLGLCSLDEAVASMKRATRHYARRQMTWFRSIPEVRWIESGEERALHDEIHRYCLERRSNRRK